MNKALRQWACIYGLLAYTSLVHAHDAPMLPAGTQQGDLIFREGTEAVSAAVMALDQGEFSHVGMLVGKPGNWQVLHATPSEVKGRADGVVLDTLAFFTHPKRTKRHVVYQVNANAAQHTAAVHAARKMLGQPFRIADPAGTYCTEMIWRAWMTAGINLEVSFTTLALPLLPGKYLLPSQLMASPKLQLLPAKAALAGSPP